MSEDTMEVFDNDVAATENKKEQPARKVLTREDILEAKDEVHQWVDIPEWGGSVVVKGMTGKQRGTFEAALTSTKTKDRQENWKRFRAAMLVMCCYDGDGPKAQRIFRKQDIELLNEKSAVPLDRLFQVAQDLSGYRKEDVDEMTKNSSDGQSGDFIFD